MLFVYVFPKEWLVKDYMGDVEIEIESNRISNDYMGEIHKKSNEPFFQSKIMCFIVAIIWC